MQSTPTNYFELFAIAEQFNLDTKTLESNFRKIQSAHHPDRFVSASPAEKLAAMHTATTANEAFSVLKNPARRAKYLLERHGIDAIAETNTAMSAEFLMQQMEWRERIEDAKMARNIAELEEVASELKQEAKSIIDALHQLFDIKKDLMAATELTRKLIFIDKVCADIDQVIEQLDD
ncbi:MAG: Fe-S protein assembly co-chaperone HscB [Methylotenera sp.]|uniref:Fe-S protein assembly co-chaperone HscB n=1 Tax=Methylotenera sp. TaxID=2051956 RepID=UPI000D4C34DC|nr:Fe-S protein assembly co-chaperone HscB [Methylotenera sp.]PPC83386.1 MAG: Fe-S protein assembly co-chaperone HscB [Methylotenera sp.]